MALDTLQVRNRYLALYDRYGALLTEHQRRVLDLHLRSDWSLAEIAANQGTSIPGYWRFDAFAEARINQNWKVKLFVNNIFDKRYYDALYQSAAPFVLEAPGRAAYLVLSARY